MSPTIRNQAKLAGIAVAAGLALTAFGAGEAQAQGFNVVEFACANSFAVDVDIRGLGNTNLCVTGTATLTSDCACVGGGGNCPRDAQKQTITTTVSAETTLEPRNGRVFTTVELPLTEPTDATCAAALMCPSGQRARLIQFDTEPDGTHFEVCTTEAAPGEPCSCMEEDILAEADCDAVSEVVFDGRGGNCLALFE